MEETRRALQVEEDRAHRHRRDVGDDRVGVAAAAAFRPSRIYHRPLRGQGSVDDPDPDHRPGSLCP